MIPQETIIEALERLVKAYDPLAIYMYGKYARGNADEDDDLELLIVIESSDEDYCKRGYRAFDALFGLKIPKHITVYTKQEFDASAQDVTSLCYEVKNKGRRVYVGG